MKKRLLSLLFVLTLTLLALTACGSGKSANAGTTTPVTDPSDNNSTSSAGTDGSVQKVLDYGKLKVGCKIDVPGFGYQNTETGAYEGMEIDLAYIIAAKIFDVTPEEAKKQELCEFQGVTAKTRGPLLDNGELDVVIATFTITEERKESYNFSIPYIEDALGLMSNVASGFETMADIDGAVIGVAQGSTTKEAIEAFIEEEGLSISVTFEEFDGYPALSAALAAGNIDIFSVDRAILAGYNDDTTMILPERFGLQEYGVASALSSVQLAALIDDAISEMLENGAMETLITSWGIE